MATITENKRKKTEKRDNICAEYAALMAEPGSQKTAVYEVLADKYDLSTTHIGRIVGNIKQKNKSKL